MIIIPINLEERAKLRNDCSSLDEYCIRRDLSFELSILEKWFDPIEFVERYPMLCSIVALNIKTQELSSIMFSAISASLMTFCCSFFPYTNESDMICCYCLAFIGISFVYMAVCLRILDAKFALKLYI